MAKKSPRTSRKTTKKAASRSAAAGTRSRSASAGKKTARKATAVSGTKTKSKTKTKTKSKTKPAAKTAKKKTTTRKAAAAPKRNAGRSAPKASSRSKKTASKTTASKTTAAKKAATRKAATRKKLAANARKTVKKSAGKTVARTAKKPVVTKAAGNAAAARKGAAAAKKTSNNAASANAKKKTAAKSKKKSASKGSRSAGSRRQPRSVAEVASSASADDKGYVFINGRRVRMISTKGRVAPRKERAEAAVTETAEEEVRMPVKTSLTRKQLNYYRDQLIQKRRELVGDLSALETEALRSSGGDLSHMPIHMADIGSDTYEQDFMLGLAENERKHLREIDEALARIENGTYGVCQMTGNEIPTARLEAKPWAKYTIEAARQLERGWGA